MRRDLLCVRFGRRSSIGLELALRSPVCEREMVGVGGGVRVFDSESAAESLLEGARETVGVGGGVRVFVSDSVAELLLELDVEASLLPELVGDGVFVREGLSGTLRVAVFVYFSHIHPSPLLSSAQLPLLYKTRVSSTPPALSGCPTAQLQYVTHVPVASLPLKNICPRPLLSWARKPVFHRNTASLTRLPPTIARTSDPPRMNFDDCEFWNALPIVARLARSVMQALLQLS